jgi:ADP-ribosylglycohydrolase/protein-tyrosine phosphatase
MSHTTVTRTSLDSPLGIPFVRAGAGAVGITLCPGKCGPSSWSRTEWRRDMQTDIAAIAATGATVLVTLMEPEELREWGAAGIGAAALKAGLVWYHLPIRDLRAPGRRFEARWPEVGADLHARLARGERVVVHCRGGLGRAGTVAARLLIETGVAADDAIGRVRHARRGAIQTAVQTQHLVELARDRHRRAAAVAVDSIPSPQAIATRSAIATESDLARRIAGGMWGLLIGDAAGVPYEFKSASSLPASRHIGLVPPAGFARTYAHVPVGTWSDDGAQALCLAQSLLERGDLDCGDLGRRLLAWRDLGHLAVDARVFDCGIQTGQALARIRAGADPASAGADDTRANGNGSLMRVLPLALWHRESDTALAEAAHRQSRVTHGHLLSQVVCALYCLWARTLSEGHRDGFDIAVARLQTAYACGLLPDHASALRTVLDAPERDAPRGTGYVVDTLWSAHRAMRQPDYASVLRTAIGFGNDTDTTACVAGGLAGVREGIDGIPADWFAGLRGQDLAGPLVAKLVARA